jgi:phosphoribosyl 1,2-cyclic phosphate phosphodiesterase
VNLRTRSGALVDDDLKIDFCPDTLVQMQRTGRHLANIKTLVFTHQHEDHISPLELQWCISPFSNTPPGKIDVYAPQPVIQIIQEQCPQRVLAVLDLHTLTPLEAVTTAQGDRILPLPADHVQGAVVLLITRQGKTLFYGHDSGLYPEPTLDALQKHGHVDLVLMECTGGGQQTTNRNHLSATGVRQMQNELKSRGVITEKSRVVVTHFSHNGKWLHEELVAFFTPLGIDVAYDGMTLDI